MPPQSTTPGLLLGKHHSLVNSRFLLPLAKTALLSHATCGPLNSAPPSVAWRGLLSRVLRLGPRRLFASPGCLVVDRDTRRTQPSQQYSPYRGGIESNILGIWWMCLAALQSERQMQLLAKVPNDEIDLIVSHDLLFLLPFCYPTSLTESDCRGLCLEESYI